MLRFIPRLLLGRRGRLLAGYLPCRFAHALLALFLLVEEFAFAADVAAVALGDDVLTDGGDGLACDDLGADGRPG